MKWIIPYQQRPSFILLNDVPPVLYECLIPIILMHLLSLYNINTYPPPNFKKKRALIDHNKYIQLIFFFPSQLPSELLKWIFFSQAFILVQVQNMLNIAFYATPVTVCSSPQIVQSNKKSRGVGYALFLPLLNISILIIIQNIGSATYCPYIHLLGVFSLSTYRLIQI